MPGDFRWHAFTVISVLLAFGLGVLAGVALPQESLLLERQQALIQRLEEDFRSLRADNQRLADWAAQQEERDRAVQDWARRLAHLASAGRLAGRPILLLTWGQVPDELAADLTGALTSAGAEPYWARADEPTWPDRLRETGPQGVVVLDAGRPEPLQPLLSGLRDRLGDAVPLVLATVSQARAAEAARQVASPFMVVDHPADPLGQVAVILGLLGIEGYYGYGAAADGPIPPASTAVPALRGTP